MVEGFHTTEINDLWIIWRATNYGSFIFQKINLQGRNKLIVLSMSANEFTEVPLTIGCKISQGMACLRWLQSKGAIWNQGAINHKNLSILEGLTSLIGSHLTREPTANPVLSKWLKWELMLVTNFGSLCPKVTNFGSQTFGYQIWFCTRLFKLRSPNLDQSYKIPWLRSLFFWGAIDLDHQGPV